MPPADIPYSEHEARIRLGGPAGFGIKAAGQTLARSFVRAGLQTFDLTEYPSLIKGGHNTYLLRVSPEPVYSHVEPLDVLVALDTATVDLHLDELVMGGAIVYDPADVDASAADSRTDLCRVEVPLAKIVDDAGGQKIMRNVAALGAVLGLLDFPLDYLTNSLKQQFAKKDPSVAELNIVVATGGWNHANAIAATCAFPVSLAPVPDAPTRMLVDGNEAMGLGAIAAGVGFYAAYPMTPASPLLHFMAAHDREYGYVVKHTEDEIAAMNMVVGAAFSGARAMCATAGGGFSLMVEAFGLAGVTESAVVVGLFTRPGPATGLPTWTEQSDLRFILHAAQGEFPRVVLAPGDREEAFELAWRAFNLADALQTPVVLLADTYLCDNRASCVPFDASAVTVDRGRIITDGDITQHPEALDAKGAYARYKVDGPAAGDGVSWRALPGVHGALQIVNSYEHDERGWADETSAMRTAQNEKRMRKLQTARSLVPPPKHYGPPEADVSLIVFGTTKSPALQAMGWAEARGVSVNMLQLVTVWPFPAEEVASFLRDAERSVVVEGNFTGQLEGLIREQCLIAPDDRLHRYDGRPFSPEQILATIERVMSLAREEVTSGANS